MLTDRGLTWLARRDRAAVGQVLDRWTAEPSPNNPHVYAGTALRAMATQPEHQAALTTLAAGLTAECARSRDHGVLDLLSTSRPAVGYWHDDKNYVVHPDVSFVLDLPEGYRHCFLEYRKLHNIVCSDFCLPLRYSLCPRPSNGLAWKQNKMAAQFGAAILRTTCLPVQTRSTLTACLSPCQRLCGGQLADCRHHHPVPVIAVRLLPLCVCGIEGHVIPMDSLRWQP